MNVPTYRFLLPSYVGFFCFNNENRINTRLYHLRIQRLEKQVQIEFPSSVVLVPVPSAIIMSKSCMYHF